ncbi:class E sortase [Streptomyces sp. NPDC093094]|uniref:class E sortase n=1 Tax=Streptomyces sp. NPDC093094 TaxID=3366026 RepID=UPI00382EC627
MTSDWYGAEGYAGAREQPYAPYPPDAPYQAQQQVHDTQRQPYGTQQPSYEAQTQAYAAQQPYDARQQPQPYEPQPQPYEPQPQPYEAQAPSYGGREGAYGAQEHPYEPDPGPLSGAPAAPRLDDETVALRMPPVPGESIPGPLSASGTPGGDEHPAGGRAARRKAAKRRHGRHGGTTGPSHTDDTTDTADTAPAPDRSLSRVEARRQARARRPGPAVIASRVIGEMFITTGVLMLLFVTYQLWWTNVRAHAQAGSEAEDLQKDWASGRRSPGVFEPGEGFAILRIPKLDVVVPIAEGVSGKKVLDKGMVGHYGEKPLKTAMPDAKTGNFGLAGHRNTHGEPFRYINRLQPGDPIVVETQDTYFVYKMASILPVTSPSNVSVLDLVPKGSGFTGPGRYITLTTCTPEFTSKYRMIVWGKMVEERPRSKGKPDALVS